MKITKRHIVNIIHQIKLINSINIFINIKIFSSIKNIKHITKFNIYSNKNKLLTVEEYLLRYKSWNKC